MSSSRAKGLNEGRINAGRFAPVYKQRLKLNSELRTHLGKQLETGSTLSLCVEYTRIKGAESLGMQLCLLLRVQGKVTLTVVGIQEVLLLRNLWRQDCARPS